MAKWTITSAQMREFAQEQLGKKACEIIAANMGEKYQSTGLHMVASFTQVMYVVALNIANGHFSYDGSVASLSKAVLIVMKDVEAGAFDEAAVMAQSIGNNYTL